MENFENRFDSQIINKITNKFAIPSVYITEICAERVGAVDSAEDKQKIVMFAQRAVNHIKEIASIISRECENSPNENEIYRIALGNKAICRFFLQAKQTEITTQLNILGKGGKPSIEEFLRMVDPSFSIKEYMQSHEPWA